MNIDIFRTRPQNDQTAENRQATEGFFGRDAGVPEFVDLDNLTQNNSAVFPDREQAEVDNLARAMTEDVATYVDSQGAIHIEGEADGVNMTKVDGNIFGAPTPEDEVARLSRAMYNDSDYFVDEYGRIRLGGEPGAGVNMTKVDGNIFGTPTPEEEEVARLSRAMQDDNGDGYFVDEFGRIRLDGEPGAGINMTKVDGNVFGAHEDQWYNRNPQLYRAEIATMRTRYPKAAYGFLSTNGNMYWMVTIQVFQNPNITKPWKFMLVYDKDHPHNHGFGGSIKVVPMNPSLDDLKRIAAQHGRPGVPHVISNPDHFLKKYLCTRWPKDIENGNDLVSSATQATAWAADWAAHFEVGIRDKKAWNKWCDDSHFRHMQVK